MPDIVTLALALLVSVELWYWLWYFPHAWKNAGQNRQVDDIRFFVQHLTDRGEK